MAMKRSPIIRRVCSRAVSSAAPEMAKAIIARHRSKMHKTTPAALQRPQVARLLWGQALVIVIAVLLAGVMKGSGAALSVLCGGLVCLLPNLFFAWRSLRVTGARYAQAMVKAFYQAEAGKFGLTAVLFAFFFIAVPPSNPALFFCAYVAAMAVHWLGPWLVKRTPYTRT